MDAILLRAKLINNEAQHALMDSRTYTEFYKFKEADDKRAEAEVLMRQAQHLIDCFKASAADN